MRQWIRPRSLLLHLIFLVVAGGCGIAAWWQITRAMQGNVLSYLYSIEWPAIAIVVGIGWWQLVHDTPEDIARRTEFHRRMRAASAEVVARTLPRSATALTVESEEAAGRVLGAPATGALTAGSPARPGRGSAGTTALVPAGLSPAEVAAGDMEARLLPPDEAGQTGSTDELDEYNRYLATLALKGRPKTWRNPHGL